MKRSICSIGNILFALTLCVVPFCNLVIKGVFSWHVLQPEFWQGGLELILFVVVVTLFSINMKEKFSLILSVFAVLYLSLSGVLIPCVMSAIYLEMIMYIGYALIVLGNGKKDVMKQTVAGISTWLFVVIVCSAMGYGTINAVRIITIALFILAIIITREEEYTPLYRRLNHFIQSNSDSAKSIIVIIYMVFFVLMLFAKTNRAIDHDSLWYGLKSEYVLVGENSFFDYLGLTSFVFYYPKLSELFMLPLSGMEDYSVVISANIWLLVLVAIVIYKILKNIVDVLKEVYILLIVLSIITIPSVSNIAATAKADTLGLLFVIMALYFYINYLKGKEVEDYIFMLCSLCMCTGTKLTYLLWGGLFFIVSVVVVPFTKAVYNRCFIIPVKKINATSWVIGITTLIGVFGIHLRTFLLTGYPIYPTGLELWNKLGFKAKNMIESDRSHIQMTGNTNYLRRIYEIIFDNSNLEHMVMQWASNITIFLVIFVVVGVFITKKRLKFNYKILALIITESIVALYYILSMNLPDSNYFNFPICLIIIFTSGLILQLQSNKKRLNRPLVICLCIFITFQSIFSLLTHFSWSYGTHKVDFEVVKDNFESIKCDRDILEQNGIAEIGLYLESSHYKRVLTTNNDYQVSGRLKCWVQVENDVSSYYSNKNIMNSYDGFCEYVKYAGVNGFIIYKDNEGTLSQYVKRLVNEKGCTLVIEDQAALYYEISSTK